MYPEATTKASRLSTTSLLSISSTTAFGSVISRWPCRSFFFLRALAQRGRSAPPRSCQTILSNAWPLVQIDNMNESKNSEPVLAEVGPRFVLNPIRIFGVRPACMGTTLSRG